MPMGRLAMQHVRKVMRLKAAGLSIREIGRRVGSVPSTRAADDPSIRSGRAEVATWDGIADTVLEEPLFGRCRAKPG